MLLTVKLIIGQGKGQGKPYIFLGKTGKVI